MLSARNDRLECPKELLIGLVRTVEFIIDISVSKHSIFHLSSSRNHLHTRIKAILKHGTKIKHHIIYSQPSFAAFDSWLEETLIDFSLLTILQTRRHDLEDLYYEWAFLRNQHLFDAFIDILRVLSTRDAAPLLKIMTMEANLQISPNLKSQAQTMPLSGDPLLASLLGTDSCIPERLTTPPVTASRAINIPANKNDRLGGGQVINEFHSNSCRNILDQDRRPAAVIDNIDENLESNIPNFSYSYQSPASSPPLDRVHPESLPASGLSVPKASSLLNLPIAKTSSECESVSQYESVISAGILSRQKSSSDEGKLSRKKSGWNESFLESGGMVLPPAMGHFPTPQKGQTLTSFLSSLSDNLPDLDRENAHFNVSEALISAFERIKIQKYQQKQKAQQTNDESGEEDVFGTVTSTPNPPAAAEEGTHGQGPSKSPRRYRGGRKTDPSYTETEESELEYWRQQPRKPPPYLRKKPRPCTQSDGQGVVSHTSSSFTSSEEDFLSSSYSAENVALQLLRNSNVTDKQLPPASELQWLVSELEAPQALLPLPKTKSASESESDYNSGSATESSIGRIDNHIRLRGSLDWAPPRPQIIFTVHPPPSINILTKTQRCRCAGCGTRVDMKYVSTFRYCYYLGRYFCTGCHTGKRARLPQMIIHQWDFSPHPVSNFAATLLEKLQSDPVYNILAINKTIYKKVKLNNFRNYRIQLGILKEYIQNCRTSNYLQGELSKFPQYYSCDVDLYSLEDLVHLRFSTGLPMKTKEFVTEAVKHVLSCELCKELGFICEICNRNEILFAFQINRISRCSLCASCFHLKCFNPGRNSCPKCLRISARKSNQDVHTAIVSDLTEPSTDGLNVAC